MPISFSNHAIRVEQLLRLSFAHVQMVLYKPFLHYISCHRADTPTSGQCYAYAAACIDTSRNVVHNERQMEQRNELNGPYWFTMYTTFCATLSLSFYAWENMGTLSTVRDAEYGRDVLSKFARTSMAAASHSALLSVRF